MTKSQPIHLACLSLAVIVCLGISAADASADVQYHITDLGTLGGTYSNAQGINVSGHVTGSSTGNGDIDLYAFLYTPQNGMVNLNSLIDPQSGWELSTGSAINDAGQITGLGLIGGEHRAFLLTPVPEPISPALFVFVAAAWAMRHM